MSSRPLRTYSLTFPEYPEENEAVYSRLVAQQIGSRHHEIEVRVDQLWSLLPSVFDAVEEPCSGTPAPLMYLISQAAGNELKVVLGGEGADELFAGYPWYKNQAIDQWRSRVPSILSRTAAEWVTKPRWHRALMVLSAADDQAAHLASLGTFPESLRRHLLKIEFQESGEPGLRLPIHRKSWESCEDLLQQRLCVDMMGRLPEGILLVADKTSMAHSLELRLPFLARQVVELALSLPSHYKLRNGQEKYLLSRLTHRLPKELRKRRKQGLRLPYKQMFRTARGKKNAREYLLDSCAAHELFQTHNLEQWVEKTLSGKLRDGALLWRVLVLSVWWEQVRHDESSATDSPTKMESRAA